MGRPCACCFPEWRRGSATPAATWTAGAWRLAHARPGVWRGALASTRRSEGTSPSRIGSIASCNGLESSPGPASRSVASLRAAARERRASASTHSHICLLTFLYFLLYFGAGQGKSLRCAPSSRKVFQLETRGKSRATRRAHSESLALPAAAVAPPPSKRLLLNCPAHVDCHRSAIPSHKPSRCVREPSAHDWSHSPRSLSHESSGPRVERAVEVTSLAERTPSAYAAATASAALPKAAAVPQPSARTATRVAMASAAGDGFSTA